MEKENLLFDDSFTTGLEKQIADLKRQLADKEKQIADLKKQLADKNNKSSIEQMKNEKAEKDKENLVLAETVKRQAETMQNMQNENQALIELVASLNIQKTDDTREEKQPGEEDRIETWRDRVRFYFPQFKNDYARLKDLGIIEEIGTDKLRWNGKKNLLAEYFGKMKCTSKDFHKWTALEKLFVIRKKQKDETITNLQASFTNESSDKLLKDYDELLRRLNEKNL